MHRNQHFLDKKVTYIFRPFHFLNYFSPSFFLFSFQFAAVIDFLLGLLAVKKTSKKVSSRWAVFAVEYPHVVAGNVAWVFHSTFWAFLCISQAPLVQSLWSGYHWRGLFLLQKLSIDNTNFGKWWWRQKWKKGQGLSLPVMVGKGVKGLMYNAKCFVYEILTIYWIRTETKRLYCYTH